MKLRSKVGISALALLFAILPVMACAVPGGVEQECCKKMAEQCGQAGMAQSHPCCQTTATSLPNDSYIGRLPRSESILFLFR